MSSPQGRRCPLCDTSWVRFSISAFECGELLVMSPSAACNKTWSKPFSKKQQTSSAHFFLTLIPGCIEFFSFTSGKEASAHRFHLICVTSYQICFSPKLSRMSQITSNWFFFSICEISSSENAGPFLQIICTNQIPTKVNRCQLDFLLHGHSACKTPHGRLMTSGK